MLRSRRLAMASKLAFALTLAASHASADNVDDDDLQRPQRLTVGVADDLLGQVARDGKTLYFVSNRDTTNQIFQQNLVDGHERQLFDDGADVTWPRLSPNGASLLYISFRDSASGQLCVRDLPNGDNRRCLSDTSAALQAEWIDAERIALISRQSTHADLRVLEVKVGSSLRARTLLDRNMTSPAVSPDGKWLLYVPVTRTTENVGPAFAAHAAQSLEAVPIASAATATPTKIVLPLPGQTGQPAFARDGKSIYVVQFFTDTNRDGTVDASDHGVLFRVPIAFDAAHVAGAAGARIGAPEQLTETSWNCEYPAPSADRLIATCSEDASLDVYSLPEDGEVPADWSMPALINAIDDADTLVQEQLLASRRLARETTVEGRRHALLALALIHVELEQFGAATFYTGQLDTLHDAAMNGATLPLQMIIEERQAERRQEQGRLMEGFVRESRARLDKLKLDPAEGSMAEDLTHLARAEIFDVLGDKARARTEIEAVTVDPTTPAPVVEAYYKQADSFYRQMDDREALVAVCRKLAATAGLRPDEQLRYARAAVRAMVRGLPCADAETRLLRERASATASEAELVFAIDLTHAVLAIRDAHPAPSVGQALIALYAAQTRPGRRRVLIVDAVQRADDRDADDVLDALAQRDIQDVKRGTHERGEAEDVYERLILARAYERATAKNYQGARTDFDAVVEQTGSFEAVVGSIDMARLMNEDPAAIEAVYKRPNVPTARANFAQAYLLARQLPQLDGDAHAKAAAAALAALDASWAELKEERTAQALFGALLHEEYLQTGALETAERANTHYLVALELMGDNPRFRALILGQLGLLHTDVGNYRIALGYLLERDKLPYRDDPEGLDVLLSKAQALLHVGRETEAAAAGDAALAMIARTPALSGYQLLALDWAAVDHLSAGQFDKALALYDREVPLLDAARDPLAERNRLVVRVSRAAAAIGAKQPARAISDLDYVDSHLRLPSEVASLHWAHATDDHVLRAYRLITSGLRASAERQRGQLDAEAKAIETRHAILDEQRDETERVEIGREEMLAESQLALNAAQRHDVAATRDWLTRAVTRAEELRLRAAGVSTREQLDVIWLAAELTLAQPTPRAAPLVPDLGKRIADVSTELAKRHEPLLRSYQGWFEIYGALIPPPPTTRTTTK